MGFGITEAINAATHLRKSRIEDETSRHMQGFQQQGAAYDPGDDYDGQAFNNAQMNWLNTKMKQDDVRKLRFQRMKDRIEEQHLNIKTKVQQAEGLLSLGDFNNAITKYGEAYGHFVDGNEVEFDKENNAIITKNMDGTQNITKYNSRDEMLHAVRSMGEMVMDKDAHAQMAIPARIKIEQHNMDRLSQPSVLRNKKGETIEMVTGLYDTKTGRPFQDPVTGEYTGVMYRKGNYMLSSEWVQKQGFETNESIKQQLENENKAADTELKKEQAGYYKRGIGKGSSSEGISTMEKEVNLYMKAYGLNRKEATDMVRDDKLKSLKVKQYLEESQFEDDPEKLRAMRQKLGLEAPKPMSEKEYFQSLIQSGKSLEEARKLTQERYSNG